MAIWLRFKVLEGNRNGFAFSIRQRNIKRRGAIPSSPGEHHYYQNRKLGGGGGNRFIRAGSVGLGASHSPFFTGASTPWGLPQSVPIMFPTCSMKF